MTALVPGSAHASTRGARTAEEEVQPGQCVYAAPHGRSTGVKTCYTAEDGRGTFTVQISKNAAVMVRVAPDAISHVVPASKRYMHAEVKDPSFATFQVVRQPFPNDMAATILTEGGMEVTLRFLPSRESFDTQVLLVRPNQRQLDEALERRVSERTRQLEAPYSRRLRRLDEVAAERGRRWLAARSLGQTPRVVSLDLQARHDYLRLRARSLTEIGSVYLVGVRLDPRSAEDVPLAMPRGFVEGNGRSWPIAVSSECTDWKLVPGQVVDCSLVFPLRRRLQSGEALRVEFRERSGRRSVGLGGITPARE
jgi:hypothetical protein